VAWLYRTQMMQEARFREVHCTRPVVQVWWPSANRAAGGMKVVKRRRWSCPAPLEKASKSVCANVIN
jgi:hypothetical protein